MVYTDEQLSELCSEHHIPNNIGAWLLSMIEPDEYQRLLDYDLDYIYYSGETAYENDQWNMVKDEYWGTRIYHKMECAKNYKALLKAGKRKSNKQCTTINRAFVGFA